MFSGLVDDVDVSVGARSGPVTSETGVFNGLNFFVDMPLATILSLSSPALNSYDFTTIGPIDVGASLYEGGRFEAEYLATSFGYVNFTNVSDVTFAATLVPEPRQTLLLILGAIMLFVYSRRNKRYSA